LKAEQQQAFRDFAGEGIFRVSVGLEDPEDLCGDLEGALAGLT
jgi:methionine-gamma-lyase